jgi:uncharacterized SAM-binding protein YcdF (DUF218 family)
MFSNYKESATRLTSLAANPDVIIIPGSGLHTSSLTTDKLQPSWDARLRIAAGVHLFNSLAEKGEAPKKVIVCGGEVFQGYDPLAEVSKRRILKKVGLSDTDVLTVTTSRDTIADIRGAKNVMDELGLGRGVVISNSYHIVAGALALKYGLSFRSAESILRETSPRHKALVDALEQSESIKKLQVEQLLRALIVLMPGGETLYQHMAQRSLSARAVISEFDPKGIQKIVNPEV